MLLPVLAIEISVSYLPCSEKEKLGRFGGNQTFLQKPLPFISLGLYKSDKIKHNLLMKPGIYPAVLTPFTVDLKIDKTLMKGFCDELLNEGVTGLTIFGSTGEANSLGLEEKIETLEDLVGSGIPADCLVVGTGCCSMVETVQFTRAALAAGVRHFLMLPPFYYKNVTDVGVINYYSHVIQQIGGAQVRILLYHIPAVSGVPLTMAVLKELFATYPDQIIGIKDSSGDRDHMVELCEKFSDKLIFTGNETFLLDNLKSGGSGSISASFNLFAEPSIRLFQDWKKPEASSYQMKVTSIRETLQAYPLISALKCLKADSSGYPGWDRLRPPLISLSSQQGKKLKSKLRNK